MGQAERTQDGNPTAEEQGQSRFLTIDEVLTLPGIARVDFYPDGQLRTLEFHAPAKEKPSKVAEGKRLQIVGEAQA